MESWIIIRRSRDLNVGTLHEVELHSPLSLSRMSYFWVSRFAQYEKVQLLYRPETSEARSERKKERKKREDVNARRARDGRDNYVRPLSITIYSPRRSRCEELIADRGFYGR